MTDADFPDVVTWLAQPHVKRWWQLDYDLPAVTAKYGPRVRGEEPTHMLVMLEHDTAVGLAQWYRWDDYADDRDHYAIGPGELGMDYAIGPLAACGRGIGTQVVAALLAAMAVAHRAGTPVTVTPQQENVASCRVLAKNGFSPARTHRSSQRPGRAPEGTVTVYRRELGLPSPLAH